MVYTWQSNDTKVQFYFFNHMYSYQMTADPVCRVQQQKMPVRPCQDYHPAVSSTPHAEGLPLVTCPWATPTQAACRPRPPTRPVDLSTAMVTAMATAIVTAMATLTTSSTMFTIQRHSPRAPCPFRTPSVLWSDPVLYLHPVQESAAATIVVAAIQAIIMTRYAYFIL